MTSKNPVFNNTVFGDVDARGNYFWSSKGFEGGNHVTHMQTAWYMIHPNFSRESWSPDFELDFYPSRFLSKSINWRWTKMPGRKSVGIKIWTKKYPGELICFSDVKIGHQYLKVVTNISSQAFPKSITHIHDVFFEIFFVT